MSEQFSKAAVSVSEMAAMVDLSRERFYQLIGTVFPWPVYDIRSRRPFYTVELQAVCLTVRETNHGIDGRPALFYAKRRAATQRAGRPARHAEPPAPKTTEKQYPAVLAAVRSLGLASVSDEQIAAAIHAVFPQGTTGVNQGQIIRAVFVRLKRHGE